MRVLPASPSAVSNFHNFAVLVRRCGAVKAGGVTAVTPLGFRIWMLRTRLNLSQEQLAKRAEMAPAVFSRIERDEVDARASSLKKIARGLGVTMMVHATSLARSCSRGRQRERDEASRFYE